MNFLFALIYLIVGIYIMYNLMIKNKKNKIIGAYSGFTFGIILYYCIIPIIVMLNRETLGLQYPDIETFIYEKEIWKKVIPGLMILIGFVIYDCAYNGSYKEKEENRIEYDSKKFIKILKIIGFATFIIGAISLIIYIQAFGGIMKVFEYAEIIRSFSRSASDYIPNIIAILIIPARLVTVAPFAFFLLINEKEESENKRKHIICFIVTFILSIIFFIINAGRAPLIYFLLSFVLVIMYKFIKKPWRIIFLIAIISLPLLDVLDNSLLYLQTGNWENININYVKYIYQFTHPLKNVINMADIVNSYGFRLGQDFVTSIIGLIPGVNFTVSYENTSMFYGGANWKITGGTPNDFVTFSYIEFGVLGIILLFGILGYISGKIDRNLKKIPKGNMQNILMTTIAIQIFGIIPNADFISLIRGGFILILVSIIVLSACKKEEKN